MKHLLSIGLLGEPKVARREVIALILAALRMTPYYMLRQACPVESTNGLRPKLVSVFLEPSTRTQGSTEEAARFLGLDIGTAINASDSSLGKGESFMNTLRMVNQQGADVVVLRTREEGVGLHLAQCLAKTASPESWVRPNISLVVGGAGTRDHPSQVLLDLTTIVLRHLGIRCLDGGDCQKLKEALKDPQLEQRVTDILNSLSIAFVGALLESRVVHDWLHLGRYFNIKFILVAPPMFQIESWCLTGLNVVQTDQLEAAKQAAIVYTIRTQIERLPKTMPPHEAEALIRSIIITPSFLPGFNGEFMDALPFDSRRPMIDPALWTHPKMIAFMMSGVGIPARMAIIQRCLAGRGETFPLLEPPPMPFSSAWVLKQQSLAAHWLEMSHKYVGQGKHLVVHKEMNGTVVDRLPPGTVDYIHRINQAIGLYKNPHAETLRCEDFDSRHMGKKDVLFLHGLQVPYKIAAIYGLIAPQVRLSCMDASVEKQGGKGYRRLEVPLPGAVAKIFRCLNPGCVTNTPTEAETFFWVHGKKGQPTGLECAFCQRHFSAPDVVAATFDGRRN